MIRSLILGLALGFAISGVSFAQETAMLSAPQFAIQSANSPRAPQAIAVVSCQVDDLGLAVLPASVIPSREWRNLDWHHDKGGDLVCKRVVVEIQDKDEVVNNTVQLHHNFGDPSQCARGAALFFTTSGWDAHHPNYAVIAVGCPTPIVDGSGRITGWHMPECPSHVPGNPAMPLKCKFDESVI